MGELETESLSLSGAAVLGQAQPSPAIHSDVPISMSTRPGRLQLYWRGSLPH